MLKAKKILLQKQIETLKDSIKYIDAKQKFYDEVLSGKREYFSNLIPCSCKDEK